MQKRLAIYPGSFDPLTNGHLDILERALRIFDQIIIAVTMVESKKPLSTPSIFPSAYLKGLYNGPPIKKTTNIHLLL